MRQTRKITETSKNAIKDKIRNTDWNEVISEQDCNRKWEKLTDTIVKILDDTCPVTEKKINLNKGPPKSPWMTEGLKQSEYTLKKLTKRAKRNPNGLAQDSTKTNWECFKEYRKTHSKTRRAAKRRYFNEKFKDIRHNAKDTWKVLNDLIRNKTRKPNKVTELEIEGRKVTNDKEIADNFNKFYASVGDTQAKTIPQTDKDPMSYLKNPSVNSMFLFPTSKEETINLSKKLAKKSSIGPDGIPTNLILDSMEELGEVIVNCINSSFEKGVFPDCLKKATVIPLHKKKSKKDPSNYRPVSLLNSLSKIIEKVIHERLYKYMEDKICPNQFGFRPKHNTTDLMIITLEGILGNLDSGGYAIPCFFDLGKAFDTLPHEGILNKLEYYGIRGLAKDLFSSYLSNRSQECLVNGCLSKSTPLTIGVPQGSILGPLLFIIYINDIQQAAPDTLLAMYADDTSMVIPGRSIEETVSKTRETLDILGEWFAANKLSLSPAKCKYAVISKNLKTHPSTTEFKIYNKEMKEIREHSDSPNNPLVGLLINERLRLNDQVSSILSKIRSGIFALKSHRSLPTLAKKNIYFATIHSHLGYGGTILGCAPMHLITKIKSVQNSAIRILADAKYNAPTDPLFKKFNILKVEDIFEYQAGVYGWRFINNEVPKAISELMEPSSDRALTIRKFKLTTLRNLSPIEFIIESWNRIPVDIKRTAKFQNFKELLRKNIISKY